MGVTLKDIQKLASSLGVEVQPVPGHSRYCRLVMTSRSSPWWCQFKMREDKPVRMMPPLLLETAEMILKEEGGA